MPVQSGSDAQLRRMLRRYSAAEYIERTDALKEAVSGLTLTSDMIVGFPGESAEDFEQTLDMVRRVGFVALYGFTYSQRPFTPALKLGDDVTEEEKSRRLQRLFEVVDRIKLSHLQSLVSSEQEVLVEGRSKTGDFSGRTDRNEIVHLKTGTDIGGLGEGALVRVRITEAFKNSLAAEALEVLVRAPRIFLGSIPVELKSAPGVALSALAGEKKRLNVVL
jgi:tRNA-2-methylthio-N6-dimethylallyladenosine synthase